MIESGPRLVILKLLAEHGESGGLDLVKRSGGKLRRGTVYVYLARLADAGRVTSREDPKVTTGLPRMLYKFTPEGRAALAATEAAGVAWDREMEAAPG